MLQVGEILWVKIELLVFDYECIGAGVEIHHRCMIEEASDGYVGSEHVLGDGCFAAPDAVAGATIHVFGMVAYRHATCSQTVAIGQIYKYGRKICVRPSHQERLFSRF